MFGLITILFQAIQPMMMIMLEMEKLSLSQGNALTDLTSGHEAFISYVIIP